MKFYEVWIDNHFVDRYTTREEAQAKLQGMTGEEREIRER